MNFSFQFDAPKYKAFGRQENRRSTLTQIDRKSVHDRWFLYFNTSNKEIKLSIQQQEQKTQLQKVPELIKKADVEIIRKKVCKQSKSLKNKVGIKKQDKMQLLAKQNKQIIVVNKNISKPKQYKSIFTKPLFKQKSQVSLPKNPQTPKNTFSTQVKRSKSQNNMLNANKQKPPTRKRNLPCLFPIRIQRQWQQQYNKKWYDLEKQQIKIAQQQMRQKMYQQITRNIQIQDLSKLQAKNQLNRNNKFKLKQTKPRNNILNKKIIKVTHKDINNTITSKKVPNQNIQLIND